MTKELLIEIGVEELPAIPFLHELANIKPKWLAVLNEYKLDSEFEFYFTPRRLVFFHKNFATIQPDITAEFIGAPRHIAIKDGKFTPAAISFAKKCGIGENELKFKEIDGKEVLYHQSVQKGMQTTDLLGDMVEKFLLSLNFGKSMRWGEGEFAFIRPIRSFLCLLGDEFVSFKKFGVVSQAATYPHRGISYEKIKISSIGDYFSGSKSRGIILNSQDRMDMILDQFKQIENKTGLKIGMDKDLLDEVVAITEYPTVLLGCFEKNFLEVPSEAIITSMKENQRYFPLFKDDKLSNHFVVVSNSLSNDNDLIVKGNEKVLRARLSDAMFFWQSDLGAHFGPEKLKNITYLKELGTLYDKELREVKIAKILAQIYSKELKNEVGDEYEAKLERAVMLSKADLTTAMVYEFTELQGVMGSYYARAKGEEACICKAIKEQYLPDGENAACPSGAFSSIVALSNKLDTLLGLFSIGKIPNGTKDPYALRRAAHGVIKIIQNMNFKFDIRKILNMLKGEYKQFDIGLLEGFFMDRIYTFFNANPSIIKACINSEKRDINELFLAIDALEKISNKPKFKENFSTFKRLSNIIKDTEILPVDENLFENEFEKKLHTNFKNLNSNNGDFESRLNDLFGLKDSIDAFFDNVMINTQDERIKNNRIALIGEIYKEFINIADIKEISF